MGTNSAIEWTDHTFNPWTGCTKVSPGCANCYAARDSVRFPNIRGIWGDSGTRIVAVPDKWKEPLKWNKAADLHHRPRIFCASLGDIFEDWKGMLHYPDNDPENERGIVTAWWRKSLGICRAGQTTVNLSDGDRHATMDNLRTELFRLIEATPNLDWQLLTKRPENIRHLIPTDWLDQWPANVWIGTTVETNKFAYRADIIRTLPAPVKFISAEPLIGPLDELDLTGIDWLIVGGESGPGARPMHPDWVRQLRDECLDRVCPECEGRLGWSPEEHDTRPPCTWCNGERAADAVAFLFKQWGEYRGFVPSEVGAGLDLAAASGKPHKDWTDESGARDGYTSVRVGKKEAGRELDGRTWDEFPAGVVR